MFLRCPHKALLMVVLPLLLMASGASHSVAENSLEASSTQTTTKDAYETGPVFDPASGSYFEVVRLGGQKWIWAAAAAARRTYKGRRGRLAKADTAETHKFLIDHFEFKEPTWIGLRYVCPGRVLVWSDGERHDNSFGVWDRNWTRDGRDFCALGAAGTQRFYMPIIYSPRNTWQAIGPNKFYNYYMVEYPASEE